MQIINSPSYFIWLFFCFSSFSFRERVSVVYILFIEGGYCCRRYMVWETVHVCAAEYMAMACLNAIFKQDGYKTNGTHWAVLLSFFSLSGGFASHFRSTVGIRSACSLVHKRQPHRCLNVGTKTATKRTGKQLAKEESSFAGGVARLIIASTTTNY